MFANFDPLDLGAVCVEMGQFCSILITMDALHSLRVDKTAITVSPLSAPPWTIESIGFPGRLTSACKPSSLYDNSTMATVKKIWKIWGQA